MRYNCTTVRPVASEISSGVLTASRASNTARSVVCGLWLPCTFARRSLMPARRHTAWIWTSEPGLVRGAGRKSNQLR